MNRPITRCSTCGTRLRVDRITGELYCPQHRAAQAENALLFEPEELKAAAATWDALRPADRQQQRRLFE